MLDDINIFHKAS